MYVERTFNSVFKNTLTVGLCIKFGESNCSTISNLYSFKAIYQLISFQLELVHAQLELELELAFQHQLIN